MTNVPIPTSSLFSFVERRRKLKAEAINKMTPEKDTIVAFKCLVLMGAFFVASL